jgi:DNA polymerase-4
VTLPAPTNLDDDIERVAGQLLDKHWPQGKAARLIGVGVSGFETPARQLSLWDSENDQARQKLQDTLDNLREKFGARAVRRGKSTNG